MKKDCRKGMRPLETSEAGQAAPSTGSGPPGLSTAVTWEAQPAPSWAVTLDVGTNSKESTRVGVNDLLVNSGCEARMIYPRVARESEERRQPPDLLLNIHAAAGY